MRADELNHHTLLQLDSGAGQMAFAGRRVLIIDPTALGLLRKYLIENVGTTAARTVLTHFGFAHGWATAEVLETAVSWTSPEEWTNAATQIHALEGLFRVEPLSNRPLMKEGATLFDSFEVAQQLTQLGRADEPACWVICGMLSGYLSRTQGESIFVLEDRCASTGHASCHLVGKTRDAWGPSRANELRFFAPEPLVTVLAESLQQTAETLRRTEERLRERRRALESAELERDEPPGLIARSPSMKSVVDLARRVALVDATVLITGESGSGKERIARLVHDVSSRAQGPFVAVNCGAITETLLESELFGHARGAFTGANQDRVGLFEAANGGTLLLDEVGEVSPAMQVKLLRVLQEHEVRRVGESKSRRIDVRVVAATNRDLAGGVEKGAFRTDLYYRLKVVELPVPPLRERHADLLPLAHLLLANAALRMKRGITTFSPEAADRLQRYQWPGNVRELENALERAVALARGTCVEIEDLPEEIRRSVVPVPSTDVVQPLEDVKRAYILAALERNGGNQAQTAQQLKIGTATLYRKLRGYGLTGTRPPPKS